MVVQFLLVGLVVVVGVAAPGWPGTASLVRVAAAIALVLGGALLVLLSVRALGAGLTPYPRPAREASLVAHGPYRLVRHPMYLSGLLLLAGVSLFLSPWALAITFLLGVVWALKSSVEERLLLERYAEYEAYCERTPHRLVPFVY